MRAYAPRISSPRSPAFPGARRPAQHDRYRRGREGSRRGSPRPRPRCASSVDVRAASSAAPRPARRIPTTATEVHAARGNESQIASMLLRMYTRWAEAAEGRVRRRPRARKPSSRRPSRSRAARLWLAQDRDGRTGWCASALRPNARRHTLRQRRRLSGDRRQHQDRNSELTFASTDARERGRRPARQQD